MNFFDFIFGNFIFIIIIGGAIAKFLLQNKTDSSEKKWTIPKPVKEIDWQEIFQQEAEPVEQNPHRSIETFPKNELTLERIEAQQVQNFPEKVAEKRQVYPVINSTIYAGEPKKNAQKKSYFHQLTKDEIVRGVVWSEILGPPRAKKTLEKK